jgi:hypothetical protein
MKIGLLLLYISPLILSAGLGIYLLRFISRNRVTPITISLAALIFGASLWSFGYTMEFLSPAMETKLFWAKFEYFGIATVPLAWFSFSIYYQGALGGATRSLRYKALLGIIPLLTLSLAWTNELHALIWRSIQLQDIGPFQILNFEHGPGFWVYLAFSYCLLLLGTVRLARGLIGSSSLYRWQTSLALLAILFPCYI